MTWAIEISGGLSRTWGVFPKTLVSLGWALKCFRYASQLCWKLCNCFFAIACPRTYEPLALFFVLSSVDKFPQWRGSCKRAQWQLFSVMTNLLIKFSPKLTSTTGQLLSAETHTALRKPPPRDLLFLTLSKLLTDFALPWTREWL